MPDFQYTARDTAGKKVVGQIAAATEREARGGRRLGATSAKRERHATRRSSRF